MPRPDLFPSLLRRRMEDLVFESYLMVNGSVAFVTAYFDRA